MSLQIKIINKGRTDVPNYQKFSTSFWPTSNYENEDRASERGFGGTDSK